MSVHCAAPSVSASLGCTAASCPRQSQVVYSARLCAGVAPDREVVAYEQEGESEVHGAPASVSDDEEDEEESELH